MEKSIYLEIGLEACQKAEGIILSYLPQNGGIVNNKLDGSPVSKADLESQKAIIDTIRTAFPDHSFLGEEDGERNSLDGKEFVWIIDPIDGTKAYLRKNPLFATQIALMQNGKIILGISNCPLLKELMYAERGKGSFLNDQKMTVAKISEIKDASASFGAIKYFEKINKTKNLIELSENVRWARGIGDFWSYHLLAQGKIDVMIEASTKIWDIAALSVIVEEAGGRVTDLNGLPLSIETSSALATNGLLHEKMRNYFA